MADKKLSKPKNRPQKRYPTLEKIRERRPAFEKGLDELLADPEKFKKAFKATSKKKKKITHKERLDEIRDGLLRCKVAIEEKKITYGILREFIKTKIKLDISDAVLRKYCQNELGFPKKGKIVGNQSANSQEGSTDTQHIGQSKQKPGQSKTSAEESLEKLRKNLQKTFFQS